MFYTENIPNIRVLADISIDLPHIYVKTINISFYLSYVIYFCTKVITSKYGSFIKARHFLRINSVRR